MFRKLVVAYNDSPEAQRALLAAIQLAKTLNAELQTVTAKSDLPAYTAYAEAADPAVGQVLEDDRMKSFKKLQDKARVQAESHGIEVQNHLLEGRPVEAVVEFLRKQKADLLVIGLHQHDFYIARLWSTVYELAQDAPCSVLGVH
jgi:nucleotide-binding universal stress UspA family protein